MRIAHKIISTLLALQLFLSFGLCGGLCCLASMNALANALAKASVAKVEIQKPEEPAAVISHCPLHARKAVETKSQHLAMAAMAPASTAKQDTEARAALQKTIRNADCCLHRGGAPEAEPSQVSNTLQTHKYFALLQPAPWRESLPEQSFSPSPSKPDLTSSPPLAGFQLSLRI